MTGQIQRQEDDIRSRVSSASDTYRKAFTDTQTMRQEYFNFQLPRILRVRVCILLCLPHPHHRCSPSRSVPMKLTSERSTT